MFLEEKNHRTTSVANELTKSQLSYKEEKSIKTKRSKCSSRGTLSSDSSLLCEKSDESGTQHRIDFYSGPPTLPFSSLLPPDIPRKTFYTSSYAIEPTNQFEPPILPPKLSHSPSATIFSEQLQPEDDSREQQIGRSSKIRAEMENEQIVMSQKYPASDTIDQPSRTNNHGVQPVPARPPKPKQYIIRPSVDIPILSDKTQKSERHLSRNRVAAEPNRQAQERPRRNESPNKRYEKSKTLPKPHEQYRHRSKSPLKSKRRHHSTHKADTEVNENEEKLKQLQRQEELLRQIIQGITEAEMMQSKVERAKRWTQEHRRQSHQASNAKRRHTIHERNDREMREHESKRKNRRSRHKSVAIPD